MFHFFSFAEIKKKSIEKNYWFRSVLTRNFVENKNHSYAFLCFHFQDLQSEIETHRVVYDRLDGTGRKLLGSLTSQEDAVMLQRRLDEMNQRWNHLKSKSIAIR